MKRFDQTFSMPSGQDGRHLATTRSWFTTNAGERYSQYRARTRVEESSATW
jgi:hypothetical protein